MNCKKHKHDAYICHKGKRIHFHCIKGFTSCNLRHNHGYSGRTDFSCSGVQHTHYYSIYTTFDGGHSHLIYGYTGPAVFLPNGRHYHLFQGRTSIDGQTPHSHEYHGISSL